MGFPKFLFLFLLKEHCNTQHLFEQSGVMLGFSHSWLSPGTWEGGKGKCGFSGCTSDPFIPHFVCIGRCFPSLCPTILCFGEVLSCDEHTGTLCMWIQPQLCSDSVNDFTCLSFSSCNEWWPTQGHKNNPTVPKSFYPTFVCTPGLSTQLGSQQLILQEDFELLQWKLLDSGAFVQLPGGRCCLVLQRNPTHNWVVWLWLPDLLETLLWSESQEETTAFPRAFWICCSIPGNRRRRRKWSIKFPLLWKAETSVGAREWGWKWYLPARSWHLLCSDPLQNNSCFLPWKITWRNLWVRICPRHWKAANSSVLARLCGWTYAHGVSARALNEVHPTKSQLSNGLFLITALHKVSCSASRTLPLGTQLF